MFPSSHILRYYQKFSVLLISHHNELSDQQYDYKWTSGAEEKFDSSSSFFRFLASSLKLNILKRFSASSEESPDKDV
jgi:hypothetical protein